MLLLWGSMNIHDAHTKNLETESQFLKAGVKKSYLDHHNGFCIFKKDPRSHCKTIFQSQGEFQNPWGIEDTEDVKK